MRYQAGTTPSVGDVLARASGILAEFGVEDPRHEARLLLGHALNTPEERFYGREDMSLGPAPLSRFHALVARRRRREPVSRIVGRREFWSMSLAISPATLDPRPDSETLIDAVLHRYPDRMAPLRILDLGTGSGCLLLATLSEFPDATGLGIDLDPRCLAVARRNAIEHGLAHRARFLAGNWADSLSATFDIVLCNPPYIVSAALCELQPEVRNHDPVLALDGGCDGLAGYRQLAGNLVGVLSVRGDAFVEIGCGQREAVCDILAGAGLSCLDHRRDLAGRPRCLVFAHRPAGYRFS